MTAVSNWHILSGEICFVELLNPDLVPTFPVLPNTDEF